MEGASNGGFVGMVKPTTQGSGSHDALVRLLPSFIRCHARVYWKSRTARSKSSRR